MHIAWGSGHPDSPLSDYAPVDVVVRSVGARRTGDACLKTGCLLVAEHSGHRAWQVDGEGREEGGVATGCMVRQALREVRPASSALCQPPSLA